MKSKRIGLFIISFIIVLNFIYFKGQNYSYAESISINKEYKNFKIGYYEKLMEFMADASEKELYKSFLIEDFNRDGIPELLTFELKADLMMSGVVDISLYNFDNKLIKMIDSMEIYFGIDDNAIYSVKDKTTKNRSLISVMGDGGSGGSGVFIKKIDIEKNNMESTDIMEHWYPTEKRDYYETEEEFFGAIKRNEIENENFLKEVEEYYSNFDMTEINFLEIQDDKSNEENNNSEIKSASIQSVERLIKEELNKFEIPKINMKLNLEDDLEGIKIIKEEKITILIVTDPSDVELSYRSKTPEIIAISEHGELMGLKSGIGKVEVTACKDGHEDAVIEIEIEVINSENPEAIQDENDKLKKGIGRNETPLIQILRGVGLIA